MGNIQETMQLIVAVVTLLGAGAGYAIYIGRVLGAMSQSVQDLHEDIGDLKSVVASRSDRIDAEMREIRDRVARLEGALRVPKNQ